MDKITKLSQAIRLGATFREQCRGSFFDYNNRSCAIGAAMEAVFPDVREQKGDRKNQRSYEKLKNRFPVLRAQIKSPLPEASEDYEYEYSSIIIRLNDQMCWTREQIADWLEKQGY